MSAEMIHLVENLLLASGMVAVTVLVHFWGFILPTNLMQRSGKRLRLHEHRIGGGFDPARRVRHLRAAYHRDMAVRLSLPDLGQSPFS
jgi:hypothetical protein